MTEPTTSTPRAARATGTTSAAPAQAAEPFDPDTCPIREVLDRVGDKWSVYVIHLLGQGTHRFSELKRNIVGISQRMLTVTLRGLERDGLVERTIYPEVPPRVEYALTPLGQSLLSTVCDLLAWAETHRDEVEAARVVYDERGG